MTTINITFSKCTIAPLYIRKNSQSSNVSEDIDGQWSCGLEFVDAQYWDYDDEANTGSWKTSDVLTQLTVNQEQTEKHKLKIKFDDRNWNGMIIKLNKKQDWCNDCKIIKFEGTIDYPIKQANFLPSLLTTTTTTTTSTMPTPTKNTTTTTTTTPTTTTTTSTTTTTTTTTTTPTPTPTTTTTTPTSTTPTTSTAAVTKDPGSGNQSKDSNSDSQMMGIAVGVAAIILLAVILIAVCIVYRRKKKKQPIDQETVATIPVDEPVYAEYDSTTDGGGGVSTKMNTYEPLENTKPLGIPTPMQYQELNPKYQGRPNIYKELDKSKPVYLEEPIYKELELATYDSPKGVIEEEEEEDYYSAVINPPTIYTSPSPVEEDTYAQVHK